MQLEAHTVGGRSTGLGPPAAEDGEACCGCGGALWGRKGCHSLKVINEVVNDFNR